MTGDNTREVKPLQAVQKRAKIPCTSTGFERILAVRILASARGQRVGLLLACFRNFRHVMQQVSDVYQTHPRHRY